MQAILAVENKRKGAVRAAGTLGAIIISGVVVRKVLEQRGTKLTALQGG
jgi:hypothetical protein